jgi:hypothetical protein
MWTKIKFVPWDIVQIHSTKFNPIPVSNLGDRKSSFCHVLNFPLVSSLLSSNIVLWSLFAIAYGIRSSLKTEDRGSLCFFFSIVSLRSRFQWLRGLRLVWSWTARTLGSWFRIPLKAWMCVREFLCYAVLWPCYVSPCHHGMAHPRVANGRDGLQMWMLAANVLNKQLRLADKRWSSSFGVGLGISISSP